MSEKLIYALTDYNDLFGSKFDSVPYKSGMDKVKLKKEFQKLGCKIIFINPSDVKFTKEWLGIPVIYTSQEDPGFTYKDFLEDIVLGLETCGANVIPGFKHLRANNNKSFMHIIEELYLGNVYKIIPNKRFSTLSELKALEQIDFPVVIKLAAGAMSMNVELAYNLRDLVSFVKRNSVSKSLWLPFKEYVRSKKYNGYQKQDLIKNKFILQEFIPGLKGDFKVLMFGDYFYILNRAVKNNDFRASGSGQNYKVGSSCPIPEGIFKLVEDLAKAIDTTTISVDVAVSDGQLYIMEFQSVYFGTSGHSRSDVVYTRSGNEYIMLENTFELEELYASAIVKQLEKTA